jgi:translocation and assembly module TamB
MMKPLRIARLLLLGLLFSAAAAGVIRAQNQDAQGYVEDLISDLISSDGQKVDVFGLSISLTGNVVAERVTVSDVDGVWLEIGDLSLDWQPFSLLGKVLTINNLDVGRVDFLRAARQPPTESTGELPAPRPVTVDRFDFRRITLMEELVGERVELAAGGTLNITADPARIAIDTAMERTDGGAGSFNAKIDYQPESERLAIDIQGTDGPGGLIGKLLKVPGQPKIDLTITGDGRIDAWDGGLSLKAGTDEALIGDIRIAGVDEGRRVGVSLTGSVSAYMPVALQPAFSNRSALAGSVLFPQAGNAIVLETLFLDTAAVNVEASGNFDTSANTMALDASARTPDEETVLARLAGVDGATVTAVGLALQATVSGALDDPQWTLTGRSARLTYGPDTVSGLRLNGASQSAGEAGSGFAVNLTAEIDSSRDAAWVDSLRGPLEASLTGGYGPDRPFVLRSAELTVPAGRLGFSGSLQPAERVFDVTLDARLNRLRTGIELIDRLLSDPTVLGGRAARTAPDAPLTLSGVTLASPALSATVDGSLGDQAADLRATGALADLSKLAEKASGAVDFSAELSGAAESPEITFRANGRSITLSGKAFEDAVVEFAGTLDPDAPAGNFALTGRYAGGPVSARFELAHEADGTRVLRDLRAAVAGTRLDGELRLPPAGGPAGRLAFDAPDLSGLGDFILIEMEGSATGSVDLQADGATSRATIRANASEIRAAGLSAGSINADIAVADIYNPAEIVGEIEARQVSRGQYAVETLNLAAERQGPAYAIDLTASGKSVSGTAEIRLEPQGERLVITPGSADLTIAGINMQLERAGRIIIAGEETRIEPIRLALSGGTLDVEGRYGRTMDLDVRADTLPLSLSNVLAPELGLTGTLSGDATLTGTAENPRAAFKATAAAASTSALRSAGLPPFTITAQGNLADKVLTLQSRAAGAAETALTASGQVRLDGNIRLDLDVGGQVPLALIADELARSGVRASGIASPDLRVTGTASAPQISGTVSISEATFGDADGRFVVRGASAQLRLDGDSFEIVSLSGNTAGGGTVTASGSGGLSPDSPFNAAIQVRRGRYVDGTLVVATFDADLDISGSRSAGLRVAGDIVLLDTTITLDSLPPAARQITDVVHKRPPIPVARQWALLQERRGRSSGGDTALDVNVRTAKPILVIGRGINADFGGRLQISGTTSDIQPTGRFTLLRGSVTIVGRRLAFDRGSLVFAGNLNPEIDIAATGTTPEASVTLLISGYVDRPEVRVTSVPELPPEEALASLMFQQSATELSPIQLARLADALLVLSGGARSGLFEGFRRAVGIDRLDVVTDSAGNTAIGAGRYINDRTYLGVEQGIETGQTKVTIDLDVTRSIKLRAGAGSDGETEAGILFEKEY